MAETACNNAAIENGQQPLASPPAPKTMQKLKMKKRYIIAMDDINAVPNSLKTCSVSPGEFRRIEERGQQRRSLNYIPTVLKWESLSPKQRKSEEGVAMPLKSAAPITTTIKPPEEEKETPVIRRVSTTSEDGDLNLMPADSYDSQKSLPPLKKRYSRHQEAISVDVVQDVDDGEDEAIVEDPTASTTTKTTQEKPVLLQQQGEESNTTQTAAPTDIEEGDNSTDMKLIRVAHDLPTTAASEKTTEPSESVLDGKKPSSVVPQEKPTEQAEAPETTSKPNAVEANTSSGKPAKNRGYSIEETSFNLRKPSSTSPPTEEASASSHSLRPSFQPPLQPANNKKYWVLEGKTAQPQAQSASKKRNGKQVLSESSKITNAGQGTGPHPEAKTKESCRKKLPQKTNLSPRKRRPCIPGSTLGMLAQMTAQPMETSTAPDSDTAHEKTKALSSTELAVSATFPPGAVPRPLSPQTTNKPIIIATKALETKATPADKSVVPSCSDAQGAAPSMSVPPKLTCTTQLNSAKKSAEDSSQQQKQNAALVAVATRAALPPSEAVTTPNQPTKPIVQGSTLAALLHMTPPPKQVRSTNQSIKQKCSNPALQLAPESAFTGASNPGKRYPAPKPLAIARNQQSSEGNTSTPSSPPRPPLLLPSPKPAENKPRPPPPLPTLTNKSAGLTSQSPPWAPPPAQKSTAMQASLSGCPLTVSSPTSNVPPPPPPACKNSVLIVPTSPRLSKMPPPPPKRVRNTLVQCVDYPSETVALADAWNWADAKTAYKKASERQEREAFDLLANQLLIDFANPNSLVEGEESQSLVTRTIDVPKSAGTTWYKSFLMSPQSFQHEVLGPFKDKLRARTSVNGDTKQTNDGRLNSFQARLVVAETESDKYRLELVGHASVVQEFELYFGEILSYKMAEARLYEVFNDPFSIQLDVIVNLESWQGSALEIKCHGLSVGFWIDLTSNSGRFWQNLLGEGVSTAPPFGIAVSKLGGQDCYTADDLRSGETQVLSICASRYLMLDAIDRSRIVGNIYTVDGTLALELESPPKESADLDSASVTQGGCQQQDESQLHELRTSSPVPSPEPQPECTSALPSTDELSKSSDESQSLCAATSSVREQKKERKRKRLSKFKPSGSQPFSTQEQGKTSKPARKTVKERRRSLAILDDDDESDDAISEGQDTKKQPDQEKATTKSTGNPNEAPAKLAFEKFKAKMKPIYELEFKLHGISHGFCMSQMWASHKIHFSSNCDDSCPCAWSLHLLTKQVVERYLTQQMRTDPEWNAPAELSKLDIDETATGMTTTFAKRFVPLLRSKRPDEGPLKILERLVFMWRSHLRQQYFSTKCSESCCCLEAWTFTFHEGSMEPVRPTKRRKQTVVPLAHRQDNVRRVLLSAAHKIPRKPKDSEKKAPPEPRLQQRKKALSRGAFCFEFDPKNPLGFAVESADIIVDGSTWTQSTCKVSSVYTNEPSKKNLLNTTDTCVEAVEILKGCETGTRDLQFVQSPRGLKLLFFVAQTQGATLRIWFVKASRIVSKPNEATFDGGASTFQRDAPKTAAVATPRVSLEKATPEAPQKTYGGQQAGEASAEKKQRAVARTASKRVQFDPIIVFIEIPSNLKRKREEDELAAGASKRQCVSLSGQGAPIVDGEGEDVQDDSDSEWLLLYLRCCQTKANTWQKQTEVEGEFYAIGGFTGKHEVRVARTRAHTSKLVEFGRAATMLQGCPVVPMEKKRDGFSSMSFLRLSAAGVEFLSNAEQAKQKTEENTGTTPKRKNEDESLALGAEEKPALTDPLEPRASLDVLKLFLRCLACENWTAIPHIQQAFFQLYGTRNDSKFVEMREIANKKSFIVWGSTIASAHGILVSVRPRPETFHSSNWYLRLTSAGRQFLSPPPLPPPPRPPHRPPPPPLPLPPSVDLPVLKDKTWFVGGGSCVTCNRFGSHYHPVCTPNCMYLHIQPPIGPPVDSKGLLFQKLHNVLFLEHPSNSGQTWFTAVYKDEGKNIYFRAEGGKGGLLNQTDGCWWYPRKEDAKTAVERVFAASMLHINQLRALHAKSNAAKAQRIAAPVAGHYGPAMS